MSLLTPANIAKERNAMDEDRLLDGTDLPVDVSELGELQRVELECPGVYYLAVKLETDQYPTSLRVFLACIHF